MWKGNWRVFETHSMGVQQMQENILQGLLPKGWFGLQKTRLSRVWN